MKKSLCIHFQVHLPPYLRQYRFFDIGHSSHYFDEFKIRNNMADMAEQCYLPMNRLLLNLIKKHNKNFKVAFSITGEVIEQMEAYAPEALDSFKELAETGCVEFVCETYTHSLVFLKDKREFKDQIDRNAAKIIECFGQKPTSVRLTGLIYSNQIGEMVADMGYTLMMTDAAKHVMGWKSPNHVYTSNNDKKIALLLRNSLLSENISFYFSDQSKDFYPITAEKTVSWLNGMTDTDQIVNIFMDYSTFGKRHHTSTGVFEYMKYLPETVMADGNFEFVLPSEAVEKHRAVGVIDTPYPISWHEAERDLSIWLGNDMQQDAFNAISDLGDKVRFLNDAQITRDWQRLQDSDHFYFMCTRWQADPTARRFRSPFDSPYDAYINYMNIISDLEHRIGVEVEEQVNELMGNPEFVERIEKLLPVTKMEFTSAQIQKMIDVLTAEDKHRAVKNIVVKN